MHEWLLLTAVALSPLPVNDDRFASLEQCQAAGREWHARTRALPNYRELCRPTGTLDRCKFVCVSATTPS